MNRLLGPFLSSYVGQNYFRRTADPHRVQLALRFLHPPSPCGHSEVDLGGRGWRQLSHLSSVEVVGCLTRRRLVVTCDIQEEIGLRYSGFHSVLGYPKVCLESAEDFEQADAEMFEVKKFRPTYCYLTSSRLSGLSQRRNEGSLYHCLAVSAMTSRTTFVDASQVPDFLRFKDHEATKTVSANPSYFFIASVSSDCFYIRLQVFRTHSRKVLFRKNLVVSDPGVSRIFSAELHGRRVYFLTSFNSQLFHFTFDLKTKRMSPLERVAAKLDQLLPVKALRDRVFCVADPFSCSCFDLSPLRLDRQQPSSVFSITAVGTLG